MTEICEEPTPTGYHSRDMITIDNGADKRGHVVGWGIEYEDVPVSPCVNSGHAYRAQPSVWRCVNCGDERVTEAVFDQEHVA